MKLSGLNRGAKFLKGWFHREVPAHGSPRLLQQRACLALFLLGAAAVSSPATGQVTNNGGTILYRLRPHSGYERGCFPPCMCPDSITEPVQGSFLLTRTGFDGLFYTYDVTGVHWTFTNTGTATIVKGRGTYRVGGNGVPQQELSLYIQMDGGAVEHFDSGLVTNSVPFPNIQVSISTNGEYCLDTVFKVGAAPAPMPQLFIGVTGTNSVVLSWAVSPDPFTLQKSSDPSTANWSDITNTPTVVGQQNQIVLPLSSAKECYRLDPGGS